MFIREVKTRKKRGTKGGHYTVHRLVESYRNENGDPRQRTIMHLGTIDLPENRWKELAFLLEQRYLGQQSFTSRSADLEQLADDLYARAEFAQAKPVAEQKAKDERDLVTVDLNSVRTGQSRSLGPELAIQTVWDDLGLADLLRQNHFSERQVSVAQALVFGKLIEPGSELSTWRWFQEKTALVEMTPEDISGLGKDSFYEVGDLLFEIKEALELALYNKETELFKLGRRLFLFDLTNTYFEGNGRANSLAHRAKSKEKRMDCPLVSLALLVDDQGFPVYSRILKGNQSEPETLEAVLEDLKNKTELRLDEQKPILVMDRGIATIDNLKLIRQAGFEYTVIERAPTEKDYGAEYSELKGLLDKKASKEELASAGWQQIKDDLGVYARAVDIPEGTHVLVFSLLKEAKELAMDAQKEKRLTEDLKKLKKSVKKGSILLADKVNVRIGRIRQKYPGYASLYEIEPVFDESGNKVLDLVWKKKTVADQRPVLAGCYVIEASRKQLAAVDIWQEYITLTRVEGAFRDLKSDLGLRPVYHQNAARTKAHLFIGVLAYHLLVGIETRLRWQNDHREWNTIRSILETYQRTTVMMTSADDELIQIRVSGTPEASHHEIFKRLGVRDKLKRIKTLGDKSL